MKRVKDFLAHISYKVLIFFVKILPAKKGSTHLLIIKLDEIGDYMLFRNTLKYFRVSEKYKNYTITLLGNMAWKEIFDEYDSATVDNTIWIQKKKHNKNLIYRYSILKKIRFLKTSEVINCVFSRSLILDDGFAFVAKATNKIAMKGNKANRGKHAINIEKIIYNKIINAGDEKIFDSIRNANFLSGLLNKDIPINTTLQITNKRNVLNFDYFIIFIGTGNKAERKWPLENYIKCAEYVFSNYNIMPVICGGPTDKQEADKFINEYQEKAINYAGKTTLPEYIELCSHAKFLLSVDTGPVHMAAAAGSPVVALFSGVYYGRYAPYPKEVSSTFFPIYPDLIDNLIAENNNILYGEFTLRNEAIRTIPVEKVLPYIDKVVKLRT